MSGANYYFVDANVWIYAITHSEDTPSDQRHEVARALLAGINPCLSLQVVNEVSVNLIRKFKFTEAGIQTLIRSFYQNYAICPMDVGTLLEASALRERYSLSFWDSMIVSTAMQYQCPILYTEEMSKGLVINDSLMIINPFDSIEN
ncbi:PIN domain-containing protein [Nodosilinea sp. LEGE 07088]|uniref:PIN domain-containing protein n=1 Tax=Nodosilinea sp. LEGE 07088 TaxID=2777968 RepID=UPI0018801E59|nr:PIN domain-containing protein [Nodosilinea sp. LEGE 07088]MBE9139216.1 PIN domain-containing protein [Nodosilinea sp. LEGE 07088]